MKQFFFAKKRYVALIVVVAAIVLLVILSGSTAVTDEIEVAPVVRGDVEEIVSETGFVQATQDVSLAFEYGGRVVSIPVSEGDFVEEGTPMVILDVSERNAQLSAAKAQLSAATIRLNELIRGADTISLGVTGSAVDSAETAVANAKNSLGQVTAQQDQLVANAKQAFISSGLEAHLVGEPPSNSSSSYTPPTITGTYDSNELGSYFLDIYRTSGSDSAFRLSGLEGGVQSISTTYPVPLGSRGLYVQFPDNFVNTNSIVWEVPIPNNRSSLYLTNLNAYNAALESRDLAVENAENAVKAAEAALAQVRQQFTQVSSSARDEQVDAQRAVVEQGRASVDAAQIVVDKMTLRAPFSGIITSIGVEVGEIAAPSMHAVSLISDGSFELEVNVSESDIQEISIGDRATVMFDAYDEGRFEAEVIRISPNAEILDGVRAFKITLQFVDQDEKIKAGLSADIDIMAAERHGVLVVPTRAVVEREDGNFVRALENDHVKYIPVETGLRGSDGMTELVAGIDEGVEVITFASLSAIENLESN